MLRGPHGRSKKLLERIVLIGLRALIRFRLINSALILRRRQPAIELVGERLPIHGDEVRWSSGDLPSPA